MSRLNVMSSQFKASMAIHSTLQSKHNIYLKGKENATRFIRVHELSNTQNSNICSKFYISGFKLFHFEGLMSSDNFAKMALYCLLLSRLLRDQSMKKYVVCILL